LRWAVAAVLVIGVGLAFVSLAPRFAPEGTLASRLADLIGKARPDRYRTAVGERLAVTLADGSQVTLDTDSELKVNFTKAERDVRLTRGQAFFEVAKDHVHPFVVEAQNRRFVAVGTAFDVRVDGEQVKVTMVEGTVRVERKAPGSDGTATGTSVAPASRAHLGANAKPGVSAALVTTITAGEQLVTDAARADHVRAADLERSTSWRRGQLVFDDTRLADAVAELNRYSEVKIELSDPALADLRLSGAFATGRPALFVEAITSYFPIEVTRTDDRTVILSAKK
jgi:transmembrane sensor